MRKSKDILDAARNNADAMLSVVLLDNPSAAKVCASWRLVSGMIAVPEQAENAMGLWPHALPPKVIQEIVSATMFQEARAIALVNQLRQHGLIFPDGTIHKAARKYLLNQVKNTLS